MITWVPSGFFKYIWLDTKIVLKKSRGTKEVTMKMAIIIYIARTSRSVASQSEARGQVTSKDVCIFTGHLTARHM